jgi:hypothetical protein
MSAELASFERFTQGSRHFFMDSAREKNRSWRNAFSQFKAASMDFAKRPEI